MNGGVREVVRSWKIAVNRKDAMRDGMAMDEKMILSARFVMKAAGVLGPQVEMNARTNIGYAARP